MLENVPLFAEVGDPDRELVSRRALTRVFPKNSIIINEGDTSDALYIVVSGRVKAYLSDEEGKEIILNIHGPGEHFGEMSVFDGTPRSASIATLEKSKLSIISRADLEDCLKRNPQIALQIIRGLIERLRVSTEQVRSLALLDVYGRVARVLLQLAEPDNEHLVIKEKLTQQDIADRVGSSREMVSRILKDLRTGGYIQIDGKHITIKEKLPSGW